MVLGDGELKEALQLAFGVAADKVTLLHVPDDVSRGPRRSTPVAPGACLMAISRNARSLTDFPEFAQQLGMESPELLPQRISCRRGLCPPTQGFSPVAGH